MNTRTTLTTLAATTLALTLHTAAGATTDGARTRITNKETAQ